MLGWLGLRPEVRPADVDETPIAGELPEAYVRRLADDKARTVHVAGARGWVLAADTVVVVDGALLGKPVDRQDARAMLGRLSGRWHEVLTGTCLLAPSGEAAAARCVESRVEFRPIRDDEYEPYLGTDEWTDKAGGYAIQGVGSMFIRSVSGSWTNVMGLPLAEIVEDLRDSGSTGPLPVGEGSG